MTTYAATAGELLARVRQTRPLVHNITNYVVMNSTANVLLSLGASPIMAHAPEEVEEVVKLANALVVNIGTLSKSWIDSMKIASKMCLAAEKPYVLDPVGAGATRLRTDTVSELIEEARPTVIRGNASEILAVARQEGGTRGVDSVMKVEDARMAARELAASVETVVAVTGERDLVTDGSRNLIVSGGHPLLGSITGTGCAASSVVGAFLTADSDALLATAAALAFFGLAAQRAAERAVAPGSFWVALLDALFNLTPEDLASGARIEDA